MKLLHDYVYEKLSLHNKNIKDDYVVGHLDPINPDVRRKIDLAMRSQTPAKEHSHYVKMEGYMKKGSKPKVLIGSIKDTNKLINRWFAAITLEWDDAIIEFGPAVSEKLGFSMTELHQYIVNCYKNCSPQSDRKKAYKHYMDIYNIDDD